MRFYLEGDWGVKNLPAFKTLIDSVFDCLEVLVGSPLGTKVFIKNNVGRGHPFSFYEKRDGFFDVELCVKSGDHWCQVVYQLAHELCHLYCNHSSSKGHKYKWFEEAICEMASIAVMYRLATVWKDSGMSIYNLNYSSSIDEYICDVVTGVNVIGDREMFGAWLSLSIERLKSSSTERCLNREVAVYLYRNLFEINPAAWGCVRYLNLWDCHNDKDFYSYLDNWVSCSEKKEPLVTSVVALLK